MRSSICYLLVSLSVFIICTAGQDDTVCTISRPGASNKLSVCTMVRNEARYIEEWLAYHLMLKVDHFFIYDDQSTDNLNEVLSPYVKLGVVTVIPWDLNKQTVDKSLVADDTIFTRPQRFAIADCLYNHKHESEWFGIWDVDEFLKLNPYFPDMHAFMPFAAANADDYLIPMTVYGTSGHTKTPEGWVLKDFQMRGNLTMFGVNPYDGKFSGKSMYKSGCGKSNVHFTNELHPNCRKYAGWHSAEYSGKHLPLSLNHYPVKSWDHFRAKMAKWNFGLDRKVFDNYEEYTNKYWDDSMVKYVKPVEEIVNCMRAYK